MPMGLNRLVSAGCTLPLAEQAAAAALGPYEAPHARVVIARQIASKR
jgi:hypothetical protein